MTASVAPDPHAPITAIIVTYNSARTLPGLLASLEASTVDVRVVVVDNGSTDDTVAVARGDPRAHVIATGANLGYSGGINVGRRIVRPGEHIAILNPDLTVDPDALRQLRAVLEADPTVGIAAPQIRDTATGDRNDSLHREPALLGALGEALFGRRWRSRPGPLTDTLRTDDDYAQPHDVDWATGAALLIAADCDRIVGRWDAETYFLYSEETDYAQRAHAKGFRVRYSPEAVVAHEGGASGHGRDLVALLSVNRVRYYGVRHGHLATVTFRGIVALGHLLRSYRPMHRYALKVVLDRRRWVQLPCADPMPAHLR